MVFTGKKKQQNRELFSQLDESDTDSTIGQNNRETQGGCTTNLVDIGNSSINMEGPIQVNSPQMDIHKLEENIVSKVRNEVDNVMMTVGARFQDALLTAIENLVIPRVELAMKFFG